MFVSPPSNWVPVLDAARTLGVSRMTVIRRIQAGQIEGAKLGRDWFVASSALVATEDGTPCS